MYCLKHGSATWDRKDCSYIDRSLYAMTDDILPSMPLYPDHGLGAPCQKEKESVDDEWPLQAG